MRGDNRGPRHARGWILPLAAFLWGAAGCGTTLISADVQRQGDGWTIVLQRLMEGPNEIRPSGYTIYQPESGQRFIHAYFKVRNDSTQTRVFSYDACDLDLGEDRVLPGMVTRYNGLMSKMDKNETYPPGDQNYRMLTFSYPEGRLPTRIQCAYLTFEIPQGGSPSRR